MTTMLPLHPDDVLLFREIAAAMRHVAGAYGLPLRDVVPHPDCRYSTSPLGDCAHDGTVRLVMRGKKADGAWDDEPRHDDEVWRTAAHELAHLRHMDHGVAFHEFEQETLAAMRNRREDHRERVLARLVKMQAARDGEAKIGNLDAAEAFAAAINRMLIENELRPSDVDYARTKDSDPIVELRVDFAAHRIDKKRARIAWQESLARIVAKAHLCTFLITPGTNYITFVGTRSHATVAEYVYGTLVPIVKRMSVNDYSRYYKKQRAEAAFRGKGDSVPEAHGFAAAWLEAFLSRIGERFDEARKAAVCEMPPGDAPGGQCHALIRLDGQMERVRQYMDDKFARKRKYANPLRHVTGYHSEGRAWGKAAADKMVIGRRGVTAGSRPRGLLT